MTSAEHLAYHESGHATCALAVGLSLPPTGLALLVNVDAGAGWIAAQAPDRDYLRRELHAARPRDPAQLERARRGATSFVRVLLAGPSAEIALCCSVRRGSGRDDLRLAVELLGILSKSRHEAEERMEAALHGAAEFVRDHRAAIERLARAALAAPYGALDARQVRALVEAA